MARVVTSKRVICADCYELIESLQRRVQELEQHLYDQWRDFYSSELVRSAKRDRRRCEILERPERQTKAERERLSVYKQQVAQLKKIMELRDAG